jgi:hypothetical protein
METSASSGRTKRLFHRKSIATIDAIEHILIRAKSYLAFRPFYTRVCDRFVLTRLHARYISRLKNRTLVHGFIPACSIELVAENVEDSRDLYAPTRTQKQVYTRV